MISVLQWGYGLANKRKNGRVDNKSRILKSATRLIGENGVEGTSLADIAKDVGISKGTLYYYYSSKSDIVFDITDNHMNRVTENIFRQIEKNKGDVSWKEMLKILFTTLLKSETRTRLHLYLISEVMNGNEKLRERFEKTYTKWFEMIERGYMMLTGDKKDISVEARGLVAFIDGYIIQTILGIPDIDVDVTISRLSKIIDRSMPD